MDSKRNKIETLYSKNFYIKKNPTLHREDSVWKTEKIKPLIDLTVQSIESNKIKILDVGGGAGIILKDISAYIEKKHDVLVEKNILDLSPGMLKIQKKNNPDVKKILYQDIAKNDLADKEFDLVLIIDVLVHLIEPIKSLKEIGRISKYAIFKAPLENNLLNNSINFLRKNKLKKQLEEKIGHINIYNFQSLKKQIEKHCGEIIDYKFTNVSNYYSSSKLHKQNLKFKTRIINFISKIIFKISPYISSLLFKDFIVILVKCK